MPYLNLKQHPNSVEMLYNPTSESAKCKSMAVEVQVTRDESGIVEVEAD